MNLFGTEEAIGKKLKVKGVRLEVIGVLKKEGLTLFLAAWMSL